MINKYILDIYISNAWNFDCDPWVSWSFLQKNIYDIYIYIYIYIYITPIPLQEQDATQG